MEVKITCKRKFEIFNGRIFLVIDLSITLVPGTRCFVASSNRLDVIRPGRSGKWARISCPVSSNGLSILRRRSQGN